MTSTKIQYVKELKCNVIIVNDLSPFGALSVIIRGQRVLLYVKHTHK